VAIVALGFGVLAAGFRLADASHNPWWHVLIIPFLSLGYAIASPYFLLAQSIGMASPLLSRKTSVSRAKLRELDEELRRVCGQQVGHLPRHERIRAHQAEGITQFWDGKRRVMPYRAWRGDLDLALARLRTLETGAGRDEMWAVFPEHSTIQRVDGSLTFS
jgi:hypothetical protein